MRSWIEIAEGLLTELHGRSIAWAKSAHRWVGSFSVDGAPFQVVFRGDQSNEWDVLFSLEFDYAYDQDVDAEGNTNLHQKSSLHVFRYVILAIREFIAEVGPEKLEFEGARRLGKDELYSVMMKRFRDELAASGYSVTASEGLNNRKFTIARNAVVEEREELDELQGIKTKPRVFRDQDDVIAYMESQGFDCLGKGSMGAVFTHPSFGNRYVLKLFNDAHYEVFIRLAQQHQGNPCFPRFFGRIIPVTETARMVRVEVLDEVTDSDIANHFGDLAGFNAFVESSFYAAEGHMEYVTVSPDQAQEMGLGDFYEALMIAYKTKPHRAYMDLHEGNIMKRDGVLVVTDPWYGAKRFQFGEGAVAEGFNDLTLDISPERERELMQQASAEKLDGVWAGIEAEADHLRALQAAGKKVPQGRKPRPEGFKSGPFESFFQEVVKAGCYTFGAESADFDRDVVKDWIAHHRALWKKGRVRAYRTIQVDDTWVKNLKADNRVGFHWTWDLDLNNFEGFDMRMRDLRRPIYTIEAEVETRDINFPTTVAYNTCFDHEKELHLLDYARPVIVAIRPFDFIAHEVRDENLRPDLIGQTLRP
jgi:hypothetical protein